MPHIFKLKNPRKNHIFFSPILKPRLKAFCKTLHAVVEPGKVGDFFETKRPSPSNSIEIYNWNEGMDLLRKNRFSVDSIEDLGDHGDYLCEYLAQSAQDEEFIFYILARESLDHCVVVDHDQQILQEEFLDIFEEDFDSQLILARFIEDLGMQSFSEADLTGDELEKEEKLNDFRCKFELFTEQLDKAKFQGITPEGSIFSNGSTITLTADNTTQTVNYLSDETFVEYLPFTRAIRARKYAACMDAQCQTDLTGDNYSLLIIDGVLAKWIETGEDRREDLELAKICREAREIREKVDEWKKNEAKEKEKEKQRKLKWRKSQLKKKQLKEIQQQQLDLVRVPEHSERRPLPRSRLGAASMECPPMLRMLHKFFTFPLTAMVALILISLLGLLYYFNLMMETVETPPPPPPVKNQGLLYWLPNWWTD